MESEILYLMTINISICPDLIFCLIIKKTRWRLTNRFLQDKLIEIDTIRAQKIRFWSDYYTKLKEANISKKEDRLIMLDEIMGHLEDENYKQIDDLKELFDRERSMWELNFAAEEMDNLRERQLLILFDFIKTIHQSSLTESRITICI